MVELKVRSSATRWEWCCLGRSSIDCVPKTVKDFS